METYGRTDTFNSIAKIITTNYDFPFAHSAPPPRVLASPRPEGKPTPAPPTMLLGGYRCTRLSSDIRIPGITLLMHDAVSRLDWSLDGIMEAHRMKCWVAIQGKTRRWADSRNDLRSPYSRATDVESLSKIIEGDKKLEDRNLDHGVLRDMVMGNSEAIPPTVELYLQAISNLNPSSISAYTVGYGVGLAAMACVANEDMPCYYTLPSDVSCADSLRKFCARTSLIERSQLPSADLTFLDVFPYGTHDLRPYLGEKTIPRYLSYQEYIRDFILTPLQNIVEQESHSLGTRYCEDSARPPRRIALVTSLREMPSLPTVEPMLLSILSNQNLELVGALVSQKRDYAVYLMLIRKAGSCGREENWKKLLESSYPEVNEKKGNLATVEVAKSSRPHTSEVWDTACLNVVRGKLINSEPDTSGIALQGPRILRGKNTFPNRTRNSAVVSETSNLETGDIVYVFGEFTDPPLQHSPESITDPHLLRMVEGIRKNLT